MSTVARLFGVIVVTSAVAACASSLDQAREMSPQGSEFNNALYGDYLALSTREDAEFDSRDRDYFAGKASAAAANESVGPQDPAERALPADMTGEVSEVRGRLVSSLGSASGDMPAAASRAQTSFDCWLQELEENRQPGDIGACHDALMAALDEIDPPMVASMGEMIAISGDVLFEFDSSVLRDDFTPELDEIAEILVADTNTKLLVWGHTDSVGTEEYNQGLSERRASAIAAYFEGQGVDQSRMEIQGFGETKPIASNDTPEGRAENRRVEVRSR